MHVRTSVLMSFCLIGLAAGPVAAADDPQVRLDRGEILISTRPVAGSDLPEATAQAVINAPAAKVWRILDDCGNYYRTMPRIVASKELERKGNRVVCQVKVGLPFPLSDLTSVTEATIVVGPPKWSRTWRMLRGDFDRNEGSWTLTPFDAEGRRTLAVYRIHAEPHTSVPAALLRKGQRDSLPKMMENLRQLTR